METSVTEPRNKTVSTATDHDYPDADVASAAGIFTRQPANPSVIVADGFGIHILVSRGHLIIEDGIGGTRRVRKVARIDARTIDRLVILADTGYITFEAIRWCADLGLTVAQIDRTGRVSMSAPGQSGDARIRTMQALMQPGERFAAIGLAITRRLMAAKLAGQARNAKAILDSSVTADQI